MKRNGLDLIVRVMRHQRVAELPWLDLAGVQDASVNRYGMRRILEDEKLLFATLLESNRKDQPDGQAACFDLTVLPEVLGCKLSWDENDGPRVISHPLAYTEEMPDFMLQGTEGRIPQALAAIRCLKEEAGAHTAIVGLFCGPLSLALHLRGERLFEDMQHHPEYVHQLMHHCTSVGKRMVELLAEAGCDVVGPADPKMDKFFNVHYMLFCQEIYAGLFSHIRNLKRHSVFIVHGEVMRNLEMMCTSKPDCLLVDGTLDLNRAKRISDEYDVALACGLSQEQSVSGVGVNSVNERLIRMLEEIDGTRNFLLSLDAGAPYCLRKELLGCSPKVSGARVLTKAV